MSDLSTAEQETKRLSAALEEAKGKLKGIKEAQQDASVATEKNAAAQIALRQQALAQSREVEKAAAALKAHEKAQKDAAQAAEELAKKSANVGELFQKAFSEELPEKARNASAAFKLAGDAALSTGERVKSFGAGLAIGKTVLASFAGGAGAAVQALLDLSEAANRARANTEAATQRQRELGGAMAATQRATGGAATETQAYAVRAALLDAGLQANANTIAQVTEATRRHRRAGEETEQTLARVMSAVSGSAAAQRELGLVLNGSGTDAERLTQAIAQLSAENARLGPSARTAADEQRQSTEEWNRGRDAVTGFLADITQVTLITESVRLVGRASSALAGGLRETGGAADEASRAAAHAANEQAKHGDALTKSRSAAVATKDDVQRLNQALNAQREAAAGATASQKQFAASLREVNFAATQGLTHAQVIERNFQALQTAYTNRERTRRNQRETADRAVRELGMSRAVANELLGYSPAQSQTQNQTREIALAQEQLGLLGGQARELSGTRMFDDRQVSVLNRMLDLEGQIVTKEEQRQRLVRDATDNTIRRNENEHTLLDVLNRQVAARSELVARAREEREQQQALLGLISRVDRSESEQQRDRAYGEDGQGSARFDRMLGTLEAGSSGAGRFGDLGSFGASLGTGATDARREAANEAAMSPDFGRSLTTQFTSTGTAAQRAASDVKGAFDVMTGAVTSHVDALISGRESAGEAFLGMAADATKAIALQAVPKAIFSTAEGFAALASQRYDAAVQAFTAAGIYTAVAVGFGGAAAGLGSLQASQAQANTPPASQGAQSFPARGTDFGSDRGGGETVINYNFNGLVTETQAARSIKRVQDRGARSGIRPNFAERR